MKENVWKFNVYKVIHFKHWHAGVLKKVNFILTIKIYNVLSVGFIKYDYRHNLFVRYLFKKHFEDNVKMHHILVENNQFIFVLKCLLSLVCDVLTFDNSKHHQTPKKAIYFFYNKQPIILYTWSCFRSLKHILISTFYYTFLRI